MSLEVIHFTPGNFLDVQYIDMRNDHDIAVASPANELAEFGRISSDTTSILWKCSEWCRPPVWRRMTDSESSTTESRE